jgi:hypothetical protein
LLAHGFAGFPQEHSLPFPDGLRAEAERYERMRLMTASEIDVEITEGQMQDPARPRREVDADIAVQLTSFFETRCGRSQRDGDVRAAKIGKALLGWEIAVREHGEGPDLPRGSETIRSRRRRHPAGGQRQKKSH